MPSTINSTTTAGVAVSGDNSGVLALQTNNGTTAVTIDTSQNVGIGTASPTDNLYVSRATNAAGGISVVNTNNAQANQIAQLYLQGGDNAYAQIKLQANSVNSSIRGNNDGSLAFLSSTTERMRITSAGLVGIGTSSPNTPLSLVANHVSSQGVLKIQTITAFASGGLSSIALNDSDGTRKGFIYQDSNAIYMETNGAFPVIFQPNGAERMRLSSNGVVGVGQDATSFGQFVVKFDATGTANNSLGIGIVPVANTSNANFLQFYNATGNSCGNVTRNGTSNAVLYNTSSDYRLKENINPMTGALAKVQLLKPVTWTWIEGKQSGEGFIAHELQEVIPFAVTGQKDEMQTYVDSEGVEKTKPKYQGLDASYLVATLTAAIQELKAIVDAQAAEIAALKGVK